MENQIKTVTSPSVCVSLPVYAKVDVPFVQCLINSLSETRCIGTLDWLPGDSLVSRARNNLVGRFLAGFDGRDEKGEPVKVLYDWLLFIDTDLTFNPVAIQNFYDAVVKRGPGVYCGVYPIKQLKPKIVFNNLPGHVPDAEGWVKVREGGTGFMMIHRSVFEEMREKYRDEIEFYADTGDQSMQLGWDFFSVGVRLDKTLNRKRYLSEDWYFCARWREMGRDVWMNVKILQCGHIGTFTYPGNPKDVLEAAEHYRKVAEQAQAAKPQRVKVKTVTSELVAATD